MFHLTGYTASVANTGNVDVAALADDVLVIQNGHFLPQNDMQLLAAAALSATVQRCRIVSPSNRQVSLPFIRPVNAGVTPVNFGQVADYRDNPFRVRGLEELAVEHSQGAVGAERATVLIWLSTGPDPAPAGDVYTMRGTTTTAATANVWSTVTITWADTLPTGRYAVVGLEYQDTTTIAARLIFEGQYWRPGCLGLTADGNVGPALFRKGGLGRWGTFTATRMPIVQVLANAADATGELFLDIVRVA